MGVADPAQRDVSSSRQRATAVAWALACLCTLAGPPPPPDVAAGSLILAGLAMLSARRRPALAAALLGVALAPMWLTAVGLVGSVGAVTVVPGQGWTVSAPWLILGLALLIAVVGRGTLPKAVPASILGLGLLLAARAALVSEDVSEAAPLAGGLVVGAIVVAGAARVPLSPRSPLPLVSAVVCAVLLTRGWSAHSRPPATHAQVHRAVRLGVLDRHVDALVRTPRLGLYALSLDPDAHAIAAGLLPQVGAVALLDAGWMPTAAQLEPDLRRRVAMELEARGRGGEALRLLWRGRRDPEVGWAWTLHSRAQGSPVPLYEGASPPVGTPSLPGELTLDWSFLSLGAHSLDFDLREAVDGLELQTRGQGFEGPPLLSVQLDGAEPVLLPVPDGAGQLRLDGPLEVGPHRLSVRFVNDHSGPDGDRNAWVDGVRSR